MFSKKLGILKKLMFSKKSVFSKLALRNVKRSARDYLVYFLTMVFITAIMTAFHSLLFSEDVKKMTSVVMLMEVMIGMATFFIVLIAAWLINYMIRFMLEKRSREFGIYLLIGMGRRQILRLYMRENLLLGAGAFAAGLAFGMLLQQILMAVLYSMIQMEYHVRLELNRSCLLMTAACYGGCYLLALLRCRRRFRKMNIHALMNSQKQNEEIKESHERAKRWLLPLSCLFLLAFGLFLFFYQDWETGTVLCFLAGLVLTIYLFYGGLAAWIVCYVRQRGRGIFKGQNLFLLRQFSSKVKTMRFTLGTLTSLFVLALLGCSVSMMFHDFQNQMLAHKWPFDVQVFSPDVHEDFKKELDIIRREADLKEAHAYSIYQNGTNQVNAWLYTHLKAFGSDYLKKDGTPDWEKINQNDSWAYCGFDTYMLLSDYNHLRKMIGLSDVKLREMEYALHIKERVWKETGDFSGELEIHGTGGRLSFAGAYTEPFSQDGHNGGDYVIVVPDAAARKMTPYYAELAVQLEGDAPGKLQQKLDALPVQDGVYQDFAGHLAADDAGMCGGSDMIVSYSSKNLVRDNTVPEIKFILASVMFPLVYAGLVFVCAAMAVLSVQQLSDSAKYRFRYRVLHQIGLGRKEISRVIFLQLAGFYLCPVLAAAVISGMISVYAGWKFNFYTGTHTAAAGYFGISFLLFFGIYAIYFTVTYIGFVRNVYESA